MKMHEFKQLGSDPRCEDCGLTEQEGNHSIVVGGGLGPSYLTMTSSEEATAPEDDDRRFIGIDMASDKEEVTLPYRGPEFFMEMKLDRALIGLRLLDPGDPHYYDEEAWGELTYPGIPICRAVRLDQGNEQYHKIQSLYRSDLTEYLASYGVKAKFIL